MGALFFTKKYARGARNFGFVASMLASFLANQGCSKTGLLDPLVRLQVIDNQTQSVDVNFCTDPAVQQKYVVKMLVILDHSGSNQNNYEMNPNGDGTPEIFNPTYDGSGNITGGNIVVNTSYATDPTGSLRYGDISQSGTLLNYLGTLPANDPSNPQHYFALIDFSSGTSTIPSPTQANPAPFMSDVQGFYTAVQTDLSKVGTGPGTTSDTGTTDYHAALTKASAMIQSDINYSVACAALAKTAAPTATCATPGQQVTSSYVIVFASDGSPITSSITTTGTTQTGFSIGAGFSVQRESNQEIISDVQGIMAQASNTKFVGGINLFTVYYYNQTNNIDEYGKSLLQNMALAGNGLFYSAVSGTKLNYNQFLPLARTIKYTLADIFVTNSSVLWWTDGELHADTDMDGLPDDVETAWGSDPTKKDTFGTGISDSVEYQLGNGASCGAKNAQGICTAPVNYAFNGTVNCPANGVTHTTTLGRTTWATTANDPNGMNDCEKVLLGDVGGLGIPDSNNDTLPDWLEFINGVPFQLSAPSASNSIQSDGMSAYQKIKLSLPANYPMSQLLNVQPANYNLTQVSTSNVQDCYNLVVTGLPVIGSQNTVRVDVVEKSELLQDKYLYRVGKKTFPVGSQSLQFADWNDAGEQSQGTWSIWGQ